MDSEYSDLWRCYAFYCSILVFKMLLMAPLTSRMRKIKKAWINPEDAALRSVRATGSDPDVERIRRAHRNDVENIFLFFASAAIYVMTEPDIGVATNLFRAFVVSRCLHTIIYTNEVGQPWRGLSYTVGALVQFYMAGVVIAKFW